MGFFNRYGQEASFTLLSQEHSDREAILSLIRNNDNIANMTFEKMYRNIREDGEYEKESQKQNNRRNFVTQFFFCYIILAIPNNL